jgi:hypothetical protein
VKGRTTISKITNGHEEILVRKENDLNSELINELVDNMQGIHDYSIDDSLQTENYGGTSPKEGDANDTGSGIVVYQAGVPLCRQWYFMDCGGESGIGSMVISGNELTVTGYLHGSNDSVGDFTKAYLGKQLKIVGDKTTPVSDTNGVIYASQTFDAITIMPSDTLKIVWDIYGTTST